MTNRFLYIYWALMYVICAVLGFLSLPSWVGIAACVLFFLPPGLLLCRAAGAGERRTLRTVRTVSLIWLIVTLVLLVLNILSVSMSQTAGTVLYYLLVALSSPMVCGHYWLIALFLWACLLVCSHQQLKKLK